MEILNAAKIAGTAIISSAAILAAAFSGVFWFYIFLAAVLSIVAIVSFGD